jgi:hypothetical protein
VVLTRRGCEPAAAREDYWTKMNLLAEVVTLFCV